MFCLPSIGFSGTSWGHSGAYLTYALFRYRIFVVAGGLGMHIFSSSSCCGTSSLYSGLMEEFWGPLFANEISLRVPYCYL